MRASSYTLNATAAAETINVVNGPILSGVQTTQINSASSTFELINLAHKTSVTINGNGGGDTFDLNSTTPAAGLTSLSVAASGAGPSTFNVQATPVATSLVGSGLDTANVGTGSAESISSALSISDPPSFIAINVNDTTGVSSRFVTLNYNGTADTISGLTQSTITAPASDLASLTLSGSPLGNTFVLASTSASLPITLNTGAGVDSTFVQGVATGSSVAVHGQSGNDGVAISNAGNTQSILGPVSIDNTAAFTNVVADDSNDTTARVASLTTSAGTDTISGLAPANITVKATDLSNLTLDGGTAGNTFTFAGAGVGAPATLNTGTGADTTNVQATSSALTINGQAGSDTVKLGNAGSVQGLTAPVNVNHANALTANDASDASARAVTVGTTSVTGLAPATITYASTPALAIDGGAPSDTFAVTPSPTTAYSLVGGGSVPAAPPGNTLNMTLTGATSPVLSGAASATGAHGTWTFANRSPVSFSHMQSLNPTALSVGDAAATVGGSGSSPLLFTASLLAPSTQPVSASYATADGSATAASGAYQPASGTISFPAGTTTQAISVSALGQAAVRPPRTLTLGLTSPVNAVLDRAVATGTITDSFLPTPPAPPVASVPTPAPPAAVAPVLTQLAQTHARWREGAALAVISRAAKRRAALGTSFSFNLNESATITLTFEQSTHGRKLHGRCVAQTKQNRKSRACARLLTRGTLSMTAHAGINRVLFQGRFSRTGKLKPGRYTLAVTAVNAAGQRSPSSTLAFTIVK